MRILFLTILLTLPVPAFAGRIAVPADEPDPEHAMRRAAPGDTVLVDPGDYPGGFVLGDGVRLEATLGSGNTRLTGSPGGAVVRVAGSDPGTALVGFRLDGGSIGLDVGSGSIQIDLLDVEVDSIGVMVGEGGRVVGRGCLITGAGTGLRVAGGGRTTLSAVEFVENGVGAEILSGGDVRGTRVRFVENGWGIRAEPQARVVFGGSLRDGGEFIDNREGAILNLGEDPVRVPYFFWGSVESDSIKAAVRGPVVQLPFTDENHVATFDRFHR